MNNNETQRVAVIGGGPAGLMAADVLCQNGIGVDLYDAMPSLGRKFLMAGKSGLNLTHAEAHDQFKNRFLHTGHMLEPILDAFPANDIRDWAKKLGIETFVGSSSRVFPNEMKAAPLLRSWLKHLRARGLHIHVRHKWQGWHENGDLVFASPDGRIQKQHDVTILALGGASWPRLGSDGAWQNILQAQGVALSSLQASNCGFDVHWSDHLRQNFQGKPLKGIHIRIGDHAASGECMLTDYGIEGGPVYALSHAIRETITRDGKATLLMDLLPDITEVNLVERLAKPKGKKSLATHLKRNVGISGVKAALLREGADQNAFSTPHQIASRIKALPICVLRPRPIDEAISSAGGVCWDQLTDDLELKPRKNVYVAGEMLDWDAPTGGYLLSGCFATGKWVGNAVLKKLNES